MKKNIYFIVVIIFSILIILTGCKNKNEPEDETIIDSTNNSTEIDNNKYAYYKDRGYIIPNDVDYDITKKDNEELLHLYNNTDKWGATIGLIDKSVFNGIFDNPDKLEETIKKNLDSNTKLKNRKITNLDGSNNIISFEEYNSKAANLLAYMPAYNNKEYEIVVYDGDDKTMNYNALNTIAQILLKGFSKK